MADFVITPGRRVVATCDGDTPVIDSPVVYFTAELLACPPFPFEVEWPELKMPPNEGDEVDVTKVKVRIPIMQRIWVMTGRFDFQHHMYEGRWPD